jgi:hypothetical protein
MDTTTLIVLMGAVAWVGIIGWAVHTYRRKQEERAHERSMRYEQLIGSALAGGALAGNAETAGAPTGAGAAAAIGPAPTAAADPALLAAAFIAARDAAGGRSQPAAGRLSASTSAALMPEAAILPTPGYRLRERVLDKPSTLALYAIRAAMPDHEVFVGLSLADLLDVPDSVRGYDRELRLKKLAPLTVDFAITNKAMQLVAVIDLEDATVTPEQRETRRAKAEYLKAFPVRHLTFARAGLPRYQDIRQLLQSAN